MPFNVKATIPWDYTVDSINNGGITLIALDKPEFRVEQKDIVVYVNSVQDYFRLDYSSALTADNITIVNLVGGTGRWIRLNIENKFWQSKVQFWSVNPSTGNDENQGWGTSSGASDAVALKTVDEFKRRIHGVRYSSGQIPVLRILGDITTQTEGVFDCFSCEGTGGDSESYLQIVGVPTVLRTSTLTAVTAATTNTPATITDSAIPSSWTTSTLLSSSSNGARMIRKTSGNIRAYIVKDIGTKTAEISTATNSPESLTTLAVASATFTSGDSYEVVKFPLFPKIVQNNNAYIRVLDLEFSDSNGTTHLAGNNLSTMWCSSKSFCKIAGQGYPVKTFNHIFLAGGSWAGSFQPFYSVFLGSGSTDFSSILGASMDWNSTVNTFYGMELVITGGVKLGRTGTLKFFDSTGSALTVQDSSSISVSAINGSRNTSYIINIINKFSTVSTNETDGGLASITATTSNAYPVRVIDQNFAYTDLPVVDESRKAWVI